MAETETKAVPNPVAREWKLPSEEEIARVLRGNLYAHGDPIDPAMGFVDEESIGDAARAVLSLLNTAQATPCPENGQNGWRDDMENAPKDGTRILAWNAVWTGSTAAIMAPIAT